jgi:hypothetical protein
MLNNDDRTAIEGLFQRLKDVERKAEPRDAEAEELIQREIGRQPGAPYYMAQTILVQEHALEVAERRIRALEDEARQQDRGSDIFGGLFGGGRQTQRQRGYEPAVAQGGPWDRRQARNDRHEENRGGGGFLAGAAQTALGVTGGVLLGSAIASMFGSGAAQAAEAPPDPQPADDATADNGNDTGNDDFGGFDDGGGFDMGGDF